MANAKKKYVLPRPYVVVGAYLAKVRVKAGLTQREVALALGYSSAQFISNFECGLILPPLKKMKTLVQLYNADVDHLLKLVMAAESAIFLAAVRPAKKP